MTHRVPASGGRSPPVSTWTCRPARSTGCSARYSAGSCCRWTSSGVDETLDPARIALLPLPRRTLVTGLFTAALVSVPVLALLIAVCGLVVTAGAALTGDYPDFESAEFDTAAGAQPGDRVPDDEASGFQPYRATGADHAAQFPGGCAQVRNVMDDGRQPGGVNAVVVQRDVAGVAGRTSG